ncbi:reverse transcriptase domain-containing protein [Tanacetum coccineum]
MIRPVRINVPLVDVLSGMPNYGKFLKELVSNKHKIEQILASFLSDESSTILQNKVPPKHGDPGSFLITCNFNKAFSCNALSDLSASINLMPYSLYAKRFDALPNEGSEIFHSIEETILEEKLLAEFDEFIAMTTDENCESESNTKEPPLEKIIFNTDYKIKTSLEEPPMDLELKPLPDNLEYAFLEEPSFLPVIISSQLSEQNKNKLVFILKRHKQAFSLKTTYIPGICPSFCKNKIQLLEDKKPVLQKQRRLNPNMQEVVKKELVKPLDTCIIYPIADSPWVSPIHCVPKKGGIIVITNEGDELVPTRTITGCRVCIDYHNLNEGTAKDHFPLPFMDQMRMPFALCNTPATFQRCMLAIFHDMIKESIEVFIDDFFVFENSFYNCLNNLDKMLQRCKDAHLVLNWEKCHFMVKEGIMLGHKMIVHTNDSALRNLFKKQVARPCIIRGILVLQEFDIRIKDIKVIMEYLVNISKRRAFWSLNEDILKITVLTTNTLIDDPNVTMEEYIRLEEEKAQKCRKVFNWETAKYGRIWYDKDVHDLRSIENEFPAIAFNDSLTSGETLSCEPTVSSLNNEIDFRILCDDSEDEDYTPTVSCFDDLDFFKDFENEFPTIVYNDTQTSKSDLLTEPILSPQHIDKFDLNDETSLSEYDEEEQNVLYFNDLFPFNIIHPDDLKSEKDNDDNEIDIIQSLRG